MKVLFLADMLGALERREEVAAIQYRDFLPLAVTLAKTPHGPLLGPTLLSTLARDAGFEVDLMQMAFRRHQKPFLVQKLQEGPDAVCITTTYILDTETLRDAVATVRQHAPKAIIILGGPSLLANQDMRRLGDYCVLGEAEGNFIPLLKTLVTGERKPSIPGVSYFSKDGVEIISPQAPLSSSLDHLTSPDWSLARRNSDEFFLLVTQRGCSWRCAFCNYPALEGYKVRFRSVDHLIREIRQNYERHGIRRYMFADSTFTAPAERCLEFLKAIAALPFKIEWAAFARVDTITPELRDAMVASGCVALYFGIESGDPQLLQRMKKGFTVEQARAAIELIRPAKIKATASWIIGWPGETAESVKRTVDLATELNCEQNNVNTFYVTDLSPAFLRPAHFGIEETATGWSHPTMTYARARRWTQWAILTLISRQVQVGSLFDFFWLSSLGLSLDEISALFRDTQSLIALTRKLGNHLNAPELLARLGCSRDELESRLVRQCGELIRKAETHPLYRDHPASGART